MTDEREVINKSDGYDRYIVSTWKTDWDRHKDDPIVLKVQKTEPCSPFGMPRELAEISFYMTPEEAVRLMDSLSMLVYGERVMEPLQVWCEDCMKTGNCRFYDRPFAPKGHACLDFENSHLNRPQHRVHYSRKVADFEEEERKEKELAEKNR